MRRSGRIVFGSFPRGVQVLCGVVAVLLALSGCATVEKPVSREEVMAEASRLPAFNLEGRVGVRHNDRGFSGNLKWRHAPQFDEVFLLSPLGQGVAEIRSRPGKVTLTTSEPAVYEATDVESLTAEVLGWRLPLAGLTYWIMGAPAPGSVATLERDAAGRIVHLIQDGWQIDFLEYAEVSGRSLPRKFLVRYGDLELKLFIQQWVVSDDQKGGRDGSSS